MNELMNRYLLLVFELVGRMDGWMMWRILMQGQTHKERVGDLAPIRSEKRAFSFLCERTSERNVAVALAP